jgi:hypothetical protein
MGIVPLCIRKQREGSPSLFATWFFSPQAKVPAYGNYQTQLLLKITYCKKKEKKSCIRVNFYSIETRKQSKESTFKIQEREVQAKDIRFCSQRKKKLNEKQKRILF